MCELFYRLFLSPIPEEMQKERAEIAKEVF